MGLSYPVRTQIKKMLLAGEKWDDIQKATGASSATVAKIKKQMLACDMEPEPPKTPAAKFVEKPKTKPEPELKQEVKPKAPRKVVENATVEQLKQEVIGMLLYKAREGELEDSDAIRILAATTEKKELGMLAQNMTINILQVVNSARQSAIEKVEHRKQTSLEKMLKSTIGETAPQQTEYKESDINSKSLVAEPIRLDVSSPITDNMSTNFEGTPADSSVIDIQIDPVRPGNQGTEDQQKDAPADWSDI